MSAWYSSLLSRYFRFHRMFMAALFQSTFLYYLTSVKSSFTETGHSHASELSLLCRAPLSSREP
ncbi:hypothetical protein TTRE_0000922901 [Trichuris trichiura]|uniref:Uncharacterized protein n=1 Tax=Trichuris trichiura TaxID=36087 RepID=A0A077ZQ02_TRITR|nr:hypothetical protein TTRE_0000922901 [Trichuris trichiura]